MNRRKSIGALLSVITSSVLLKGRAFAAAPSTQNMPTGNAYLMAHFMENDQKLYYAYSTDARNWTALNNRKPVFDAGVDLRDPFIGRAKGTFHMVHTKGWDHPVIHHYSSTDLLTWTGGEIKVISDAKKRAWAPEWIYDDQEDLFYLFWASESDGRNRIFYTTTKTWDDITPERSSMYFDIGTDDIDLTITKAQGKYHAFHKCGSLADNLSIFHMTSLTLNPKDKNFGFGKQGKGTPITAEVVKPIEGPEIIKLNNQQRWYVYADPFYNDFLAWETTDFIRYKRIPISVPRGTKHCS
ncbi:family 43 glycosylhydrolase [Mucilaginibacter sp. KACC 22063]|uniref:family 43 glycosylhydrolase n=1 Tax=Mucilaginibacter sp. KACC 22063 TaxID=3025666 RepID=UPI0023666E1B|nr:family 43 glycosylhydrolase [Mucilaginibacter sp. KACC 22063]WDF55845.1 family 43 glycosylhydrolase [Mucilaginibacter sp. KACC 22063]